MISDAFPQRYLFSSVLCPSQCEGFSLALIGRGYELLLGVGDVVLSRVSFRL